MSDEKPKPKTDADVEAILDEFFPPAAVKWLPQKVSGNRALAVPYIDARAVQDRLDRAFGKSGWQVAYRELACGAVECKLSVSFPGSEEWIDKADCGSPSAMHNADDADNMKGGYSDALKRAAVCLGIGRYLYRMTGQWVDYDAQKKQFTHTPVLPDKFKPPGFRAIGKNLAEALTNSLREYCSRSGVKDLTPEKCLLKYLGTLGTYYADPATMPLTQLENRHAQELLKRTRANIERLNEPALKDGEPRNGVELHAQLVRRDADAAKAGFGRVGDLLAHVLRCGQDAGWTPLDVIAWGKPSQIRVVLGWVDNYARECVEKAKAANERKAAENSADTKINGGAKTPAA